MKLGLIQRIVGIFLMMFSFGMLPPIAVSLYYADGALDPFLYTFLFSLAAGVLLWLPRRKDHRDLRLREGFLIVTLFWVVLGGVSSLPFHFAAEPHLPFTDAVFEAVSALTTTGATVIVGIDDLPHAILWYRQQLQWMGGLGVAVIALAILPILGVGGMQLYRAEASGPSKQDKLTPRLRGTLKAFLKIYAVLTLLCAFAYWLAGMTPFDAITHSFATVSTGGFSTHDASMAWFQSDAIELICVVFMLAGGISFALHFTVLKTLRFGEYWRSAETRTFLVIVLVVSLVSAIYLAVDNPQATLVDRMLNGAFHTVSVMTSTGFSTESFAAWPAFLPVVLIFLSIMGACAGSTSGGMKTVRIMMVYKQGMREITRIVHPSGVAPVKLGNRIVSDRIMEAIWGFFAAYTLTYVFLMLLFLASGMDAVSAFSAVAATLNNLGPGLGDVASTFAEVSDFGKWVGIAGMLLGRLEIFTVFVLLTPEFWRH
ncbi:MAG: TrkH family potassium uptake protein [Proteobacteria bacterium]|nr:TrkH family potassium uptake protein [Pseudomonadota bacterium]